MGTDIVDRETRSRMMRSVRQRGTKPEMLVRKMVADLGERYRLNSRALPGSPDLSNQAKGWAIFVHGCFWHGHQNCQKTRGGPKGRIPRTNGRFWENKIRANQARDARKAEQLTELGLRVRTVWECELRVPERLREELDRFLGGAA